MCVCVSQSSLSSVGEVPYQGDRVPSEAGPRSAGAHLCTLPPQGCSLCVCVRSIAPARPPWGEPVRGTRDLSQLRCFKEVVIWMEGWELALLPAMRSFKCPPRRQQQKKWKKKQANTIIFTAQLYRVLPPTQSRLSSALKVFSRFLRIWDCPTKESFDGSSVTECIESQRNPHWAVERGTWGKISGKWC